MGASLTGRTTTVKEIAAEFVPLETASPIEADPWRFLAGASWRVREVPVPPSERFEFGIKPALSEVVLRVRFSGFVSTKRL